MTPIPSRTHPQATHSAPIAAGNAPPRDVAGANRVLRNTYAFLSMTLLSSAAIAAASVAFKAATSAWATLIQSATSGLIWSQGRRRIGMMLP